MSNPSTYAIDRDKLRHKAYVRVEPDGNGLMISYAGRELRERMPSTIAALESLLTRMTDQLMAHVEGAFEAVKSERSNV